MTLTSILIIDNDKKDRDILCNVIKELLPNASCIETASAEEALLSLRSGLIMPDVILLDFYMQGMDGKECLVKVKAIKNHIRTPVIIYSATSYDQASKNNFKKFGAYDVIHQPESGEELKKVLTEVFQRLIT